tara:strand:- start:82 stop:213 length:132 start_codon:yes stop_codon:yes gene_type:complete
MDNEELNDLLKIFGKENINIIDENTDWDKLPNLINEKIKDIED